MANSIFDIKTYQPKSSDIFFFDNNVWMFLFCPLGNYKPQKQELYSTFLKNIQTVNATIFVNSLILSEFANAYFRLDYKLWKDQEKKYNADYKNDYIPTERYKRAAENVKVSLSDIVSCCEKSTDNFTAIDLSRIYNSLPQIDFNDSYYIELANIGQWKIVTDDSDFQKFSHTIPIITAQFPFSGLKP